MGPTSLSLGGYAGLFLLWMALGLNLIAFGVYGLDKWKARHGRRRIPEGRLLLLALLGGSVGAWCGMRVWRHKTQHRKFRYGLPLVLALHLALGIWALKIIGWQM